MAKRVARWVYRCLFILAVVSMVMPQPVAGNILVNPSFEGSVGFSGSPPCGNPSAMPPSWICLEGEVDNYSNDGLHGRDPSSADFTGVTTSFGDEFLGVYAGSSTGTIEGTFALALVPGQTYSLSAYLHEAIRGGLNNPGGFDVVVVDSNGTGHSVGHLGDTVDNSAWEQFSFSFTAPTLSGNATLNLTASTSQPPALTPIWASTRRIWRPLSPSPPP